MANSDGENPISEETKAKLIVETTHSMREVVNLVDQARRSIKFIDQLNTGSISSKSKNMGDQAPDEQHHLRRLSEYTLVIGLIQLDITSAIRIYLKGTETYETLYATKQLLVTINEGYKQIYHYVTIIDGKEIDDKRRQSYWVKDMGRLITTELPELANDYQNITDALNLYDDQQLKEMTKPRNLAIHYDKNASKVYDMLVDLNIETLVAKAIPFMVILNDMVRFSLKTLIKYKTLIEERSNSFEAFHLNKLEELKTEHPEAKDLLSEMQELIKNFGKL